VRRTPREGHPALARTGYGAAQPIMAAAHRIALLCGTAVIAAVAAQGALASDRTVSIVDFGYQPASVTIDQGDTVTWKNDGKTQHTVTSDDGKTMDSGPLDPGNEFATRFLKGGTYSYHCSIHPQMQGTVVVLAAKVPTATGPKPPSGNLPPGFKPGVGPAATTTTASSSGSGGGGTSAAVWLFAALGIVAVIGGVLAFLFARGGGPGE
jgi:plastocyanin